MEILIFFLITLISEILGTLGGFGSSLFFVSIAQFFYNFQTVLVLTGLLHVFSNTAKLTLFWKAINWRLVLWLGISSVVFAIGGAYLVRHIEFVYAKLILSFFLIGFSLLLYFKPDYRVDASLFNSIGGGALAGFLAGFIGTGGAVRGLVLAAFNLEKNMLVGTSAAIDFGVDLSRSLIYLDSNYLQREQWWTLPFLVVLAFAGSYIGKLILNRISQQTFRKILLGLVFLIGVIMLVNELNSWL
ncbi:MAG: sulfite exporter TauE/SafE family protein [Cyclobacteriaceae bacterium]|nr:sulfite exporter TauE/SafE family protein [Cyclobacteriaceae bacterium]